MVPRTSAAERMPGFPKGRGPKSHGFPTLSAEKREKDGARKSAANVKTR
jgi:hypothetical protein